MRTLLLSLALIPVLAAPVAAVAHPSSLQHSIEDVERLLPVASDAGGRAEASDLLAAARRAVAGGDESAGWRLLEAAVKALQPGLSSADDHG